MVDLVKMKALIWNGEVSAGWQVVLACGRGLLPGPAAAGRWVFCGRLAAGSLLLGSSKSCFQLTPLTCSVILFLASPPAGAGRHLRGDRHPC